MKVGDIVRLRLDPRKLQVSAISRANERVKCVYWNNEGVLRQTPWLNCYMFLVWVQDGSMPCQP